MNLNNLDFFDRVYFVVRKIPFGKVTSYGAIAKHLGSPQSSRVVGWAMNNSHYKNDIPAHRVVNRNGMLTGKNHFDTPDKMKFLLEQEGVMIHEDRVVDFESLFWDPSRELEIP